MYLKKLLQEYETRKPKIVFECKYPETSANGWVVIKTLQRATIYPGA